MALDGPGHRRIRQAPRGRALPDRQGPLHRRPQPPRPDLRALPALGRGARPHPQARHRARPRRCRACSRSSPREDFAARRRHPLRLAGHRPHGQPMKEPKHPVLAEGKVRHVGDPVAAVVAETLAQARDAAEAIELDIEELPAVVDMRAALDAEARRRCTTTPARNLCFDWGFIEDNARRGRRGDRRPRRTSRRSSSSTTGWCRTPWSRAPRSASTTPATTSTRSTPPRRTRTSSGC